jgi:hypothetical protein
LRLLNQIVVVSPVGITGICLGLVVPGLVSPLWGVVLGIVMLLICVLTLGFAARLARQSNAEAAAIAKVPRPAKCDRCHETDPDVCPKRWVGTCPLRSIATGQTYRDFL